MSDVSINYKGSEIASMNASGTKTLTTQGKYCEDNITINYIKPVPVEVESKDVDFYDYDGTRLYSYTKQEFLALTEMPQNPTHEGLISQGWNWTLADAKEYVTDYGFIDIGQFYITDDGKTRVYVYLTKDILSIDLCIKINGTAEIDWGDGTTATLTGTTIYYTTHLNHTYSSEGQYMISIISSVEYKLSSNGVLTEALITNPSSTAINDNYKYANSVYKIELGQNVILSACAFYYMFSLESVTNHNGVIVESYRKFANCSSLKFFAFANSQNMKEMDMLDAYGLKAISFSKNSVVEGMQNFRTCQKLSRVMLSPSVTVIVTAQFNNCWSLANLFFPPTVTIINASAFQNCCSMVKYDFTRHTSVPTLANTNAFTNIPSDCKIVVPDSLYNTWIVATNWSNYASYIVKESEYVG